MPEKHAGTSALLDLAADLMEEHGWRVGDYFDVETDRAISDTAEYQGGAMCTEGAIRAASTIIWMNDARSDDRNLFALRDVTGWAMRAVCELAWGPPEGETYLPDSIPRWNDGRCCSKEQAVGLLRDAAIKTRPDSA